MAYSAFNLFYFLTTIIIFKDLFKRLKIRQRWGVPLPTGLSESRLKRNTFKEDTTVDHGEQTLVLFFFFLHSILGFEVFSASLCSSVIMSRILENMLRDLFHLFVSLERFSWLGSCFLDTSVRVQLCSTSIMNLGWDSSLDQTWEDDALAETSLCPWVCLPERTT